MKKYLLSLSLITLLLSDALAQQEQLHLTTQPWSASWIAVPNTSPTDYGVYYFRKRIDLQQVPASMPVCVTGDSRYRLYVNGQLVSVGPAKSDLAHWNYEQVDLAPYLTTGANVVAAKVWNAGPLRPVSVYSYQTGFLLQGQTPEATLLNTDPSWSCCADSAYSPIFVRVPGYYAADPGECVDVSKLPADWMLATAQPDPWQKAQWVGQAFPTDVAGPFGTYGDRFLQPSPLPQMERTLEPFPSMQSQQIASHTQTDLLLDLGHLTNAYLHIDFEGGQQGSITATYMESLYDDPQGQSKGDRNVTQGKYVIGRQDSLHHLDGRRHHYETADWRTYRYVNLHIVTQEQPLTLHQVYGTFTGYPFTLKASLLTDLDELQQMLQVGWRTARLCAAETYMDCPYYEQLQYLGDTRIQALITLYNTDDDRLVKNFLRQADMSRNAAGITQSRYPSSLTQYIQPYALSYIYSLHDYMRYGRDPQLVAELLPGAEQILQYFSRYQQPDGRLCHLPGWNFSDWVYGWPTWQDGVLASGSDGCSILMDLQLLLALQMMEQLEQQQGNLTLSTQYHTQAESLATSIRQSYWDDQRGLFADRIEHDTYSQHANALAIICQLLTPTQAQVIAQQLLTAPDLAPCSVYYKFYLHEALIKAGLGDQLLSWLDIWRKNLQLGLTTWGEKSEVESTRSDCHAWGASPNIEFFRTLLGIDSDAPAFARVSIEPHLGDITRIGGTMPHPSGTIAVQYQRHGKQGITAQISLPDGISGTFVWHGQQIALTPGSQTIELK